MVRPYFLVNTTNHLILRIPLHFFALYSHSEKKTGFSTANPDNFPQCIRVSSFKLEAKAVFHGFKLSSWWAQMLFPRLDTTEDDHRSHSSWVDTHPAIKETVANCVNFFPPYWWGGGGVYIVLAFTNHEHCFEQGNQDLRENQPRMLVFLLVSACFGRDKIWAARFQWTRSGRVVLISLPK